MKYSDPYVRILSKIALSCVASGLLFISWTALLIVLNWYWTGQVGPGNPILVEIAKLLPDLGAQSLQTVRSSLAALASALPLMAIAVCVSRPPRVLTTFGRIFLSLLLLALIASAAAYMYLDPETWGQGEDLGVQGLTNIKDWSKDILQITTFYLAALLGHRVIQHEDA